MALITDTACDFVAGCFGGILNAVWNKKFIGKSEKLFLVKKSLKNLEKS